MLPILSLTSRSFAKKAASLLGSGELLAREYYSSWIRLGRIDSARPCFKNAQEFLEKLSMVTDFSTPLVSESFESQGTRKALLKTEDGQLIEMVLIPMKGRTTLCISSQIGCRMGCLFCRTAKMNLRRNLSAGEIVSQLFLARHKFGANPSNIVFMGMGEPFDNYENVVEAIAILTDPKGFGMGPSRISVSTSGKVDEIYRFIEDVDPAVNLAISISGGTDEVRTQLMPINKVHPMSELRRAMEAYTAHPRRRILVEYVLIAGKNDSLLQAEALGEFLRDLRVTINLIPYNPIGQLDWKPSQPTQAEEFANILHRQGYGVYFRTTHGDQIMAACGQLGKPKGLQRAGKVMSSVVAKE